MLRVLLLVLAFLLPSAVAAQAVSCHPDGPIAMPSVAGRGEAERRVVPIGGYTLALSWSPEYCRTRTTSARDAIQCGEGERFGFVLHGLWPEGRGRDWPQYCRPVTLLPATLIRRNICAMPSAQLQQSEWARHGSCAARDPAAFFAEATRLYGAIRYPDMDALSRTDLTPSGFARAFSAANPGLPARAVHVVANRRGWLEEVRICLDTAKRPAPCPAELGGDRFDGPGNLRIWRGGPARSSRSRGDDDRDAGG